MRLYYEETLNGRKACVMARHLGLPVEYRRVRVPLGEHRRPEFLALNPNGRVPVLEDGELRLWEANAIMCHLSLAAGADLWPSEPRAQVEVHRWLSWDAWHFTQHGATLWFELLMKPQLGLGEPDRTLVETSLAKWSASAAVLDAHLADRAYALGDRLSVADFALSAALPWSEGIPLPMRDFPALFRWHARLQALPAWAEPFPTGAG